jgi:hypothetical protein
MEGKGNFLLFAPNPYIHGLIPLVSSVFHLADRAACFGWNGCHAVHTANDLRTTNFCGLTHFGVLSLTLRSTENATVGSFPRSRFSGVPVEFSGPDRLWTFPTSREHCCES